MAFVPDGGETLVQKLDRVHATSKRRSTKQIIEQEIIHEYEPLENALLWLLDGAPVVGSKRSSTNQRSVRLGRSFV